MKTCVLGGEVFLTMKAVSFNVCGERHSLSQFHKENFVPSSNGKPAIVENNMSTRSKVINAQPQICSDDFSVLLEETGSNKPWAINIVSLLLQ